MIKILITGINGYIGNCFKDWLLNWPNDYSVEKISVRNNSWKQVDFSKYDVIFHTAALVHHRESNEMKDFYFRVNRDLSVEIAKKAKSEGVKQFIFMSTMAVYGEEGSIAESIVITKDTVPNPKTYYGISKLEADIELQKLDDQDFKIAIIRPPMIYGPDCPGNYQKLRNLVRRFSVFPLIHNERSVLEVNFLCEILRTIVDEQDTGVFFPQNKVYMSTSEMVKNIANEYGRKIYLSKLLGYIIAKFGKRIKLVNKVFGNLVYKID